MFDNRDNVLSYPDQAMFLAARAGDHDAAIQGAGIIAVPSTWRPLSGFTAISVTG